MSVAIEIPIRLPSAANLREHWRVKAKRVKAQRKATALGMRGHDPGGMEPLLSYGTKTTVTLTRVSSRALDDDNLAYAFKAVRDEVAAYFGVNDNDPRISWRYAQAKGTACVRLEFSVEALR